MISDLFFESVTEQVREICDNLNYKCSFSRSSNVIFVYSRLNHNGRPVITGSLVDYVSSVNGVSLVSFSVDVDGRLYVMFAINEKSDENSVESD